MMRKNVGVVLGLALAFLLGCGGGEDTRAQDKPSGPDAKADEKPGDRKPADQKPGATAPAEGGGAQARGDATKPTEDKRSYNAVITDRAPAMPGQEGTYTITDAVVWVPEVSLLGGEGGIAKKELVVKRGAAELIVPFADIASVAFGELREDRLDVTITFRSAEKANKELKGTIKSNLQLRGHYENSTLEARLKLREVGRFVLEAQSSK